MSFPEEINQNHYLTSNKEAHSKKMETLKKNIKKLSYEEAISDLEKILTNVQDENISLNNIQDNYIKGHLLLNHCEELLKFVEQEINEINPEFLNID
tara:strand:- start:207 stop:497 length:291 start_codon:yes stop_codon:yes gene_type:complete